MSPAARTALVTGATGLVGSHIVERLLKDGWAVRGLARSPSPDLPPGVEAMRGDVLDEGSFTRAAEGCDVIFHTAAVITPAGGWEAFRRPNVDGTRNAITAAERSGARLLHLSSVAVYGATHRYRERADGVLAKTDEEVPLGPLGDEEFYARSKRESEQLVLEAHDAGRVWATAVRPVVIYGRRDRQFVPRLAKVLRVGFAPVIGSGRTILSLVHAANVADGAVLAARTDAAGGRAYNLANDHDVTVRDFFRLAGEGLGKRIRFVRMPLAWANVVFSAGTAVLRALSGGRMNAVGDGALSFLTKDNPFSSDRARRELGWAPAMHHEEGVPDAFRWWSQHE